MRDLTIQSANQITVIGKLLECDIKEGMTKANKPYARADLTVRVTQTYGGKEETSEITLPFFSCKYTNAGKSNPAYEEIMKFKSLRTAASAGIDNADVIRVGGKSGGSIEENFYMNRNTGKLSDIWRLSCSFTSRANEAMGEIASWSADIFILDIKEEFDSNEEPTGRVIVRGGIVQYGGRLDVLNFIIEDPNAADYFTRNYAVNDTINACGRIRMTSKEVQKASSKESSWGEDLFTTTTTRHVNELILTGAKPSYNTDNEDMAYDPVEIKKGFNARKARMEQAQLDAPAAKKPAATPKADANPYAWEG